MKDLLKLVEELFKIRQIPQFLYYNLIQPYGMIEFKKQIDEFNERFDFDKIDFVLNSPGGRPDDAYRIIKVLRNHFNEVNIIIPFWAKSAATLLALGGSNIIISELGEMGPLDVQLLKEKDDSPEFDWESALNDEASLKRIEQRAQESYLRLYEATYVSDKVRIHKSEISKQIFEFISGFYKPLLEQINPYKIGEKRRKLDIGAQYANKILIQYAPKIDRLLRKDFIDYLIYECPDHAYIIDYELLSKFLPNVKQSVDIGVEYDVALTQVSNYFIALVENKEFIGFIPSVDSIKVDNGSMVYTPATEEKISEKNSIEENKIESQLTEKEIKNEELN